MGGGVGQRQTPSALPPCEVSGEVGERRGGDFNVNRDFFCLSLFRMSSYLLGHCGVEGPRVTNFD
jgi:hypothetical protein